MYGLNETKFPGMFDFDVGLGVFLEKHLRQERGLYILSPYMSKTWSFLGMNSCVVTSKVSFLFVTNRK